MVLLVDGSFEIWRETPVEVGSLSHDLQGFSTIPAGFLARFLNHQQYHNGKPKISTVPTIPTIALASVEKVRSATRTCYTPWN